MDQTPAHFKRGEVNAAWASVRDDAVLERMKAERLARLTGGARTPEQDHAEILARLEAEERAVQGELPL